MVDKVHWIQLHFQKGYIFGSVVNKVATLQDICVYPEYRSMGWGCCLIKEFLNRARELGAVRAEVDDFSDRYRKDHNIYINCGFQYQDAKNGPEMHGNIRHMLVI